VNTPSPETSPAGMDLRPSRASSVIVHQVPPDSVDPFLEWQRGIARAAERFPGYQATDVYPPADRQQRQWVVVVHFNDPEALQRWIDSPVRSEWTAKLPNSVRDFHLKTLPAGFGPWFAGMVDGQASPLPPSWKMALTVFLGIYPTVMLLTVLVGPLTSALGLALSMLIGNALSIAILQWAVMPALERALGPWLRANAANEKTRSLGGLFLIVCALAAMAVLFRRLTG